MAAMKQCSGATIVGSRASISLILMTARTTPPAVKHLVVSFKGGKPVVLVQFGRAKQNS